MFTFTLQYREAMKIAKKLAHSVSKEETRYYLNGFYMHKADDGNHYAVSTDGHMLTRIKVHPEYGEKPDDSAVMKMPGKADSFPAVIFPTQAIRQIEQLKVDSSDRNEAVIAFQIDGLAYRICYQGHVSGGMLIDGNFPDYARVIPDGWQEANVPFGEFVLSGKYLSLIGKAASYDTDAFKPGRGGLKIHFNGPSPCAITEADRDVFYIIVPMRAA